MTDQPLDGLVAKLITGDELVINLGSRDGVKVGDEFRVLDTRTMDVKDPATGEDLGSIPRFKATVRVSRVEERLSLAYDKRRNSAVSAIAATLSGVEPDELPLTSKGTWSNGVRVGDPVRRY